MSNQRLRRRLILLALVTACSAADRQTTDREATAGDAGGAVSDGSSPKAEFPKELLPDAYLDTLDLVAPPRDGLALFSDIVQLEPGDDVTYCTFVKDVTQGLTHIHNTQGRQTQYGHHAVLYYTDMPQEPGTRRCTTADMEALRQIIGGTGGDGATTFELPENVVSEVPAGAQFVINHHWIHYGEQPIEAQALMVTEPAQTDDDLIIARSVAVVVTDFEVAPAANGETSGDCLFEEPMDMLMLLGHQHERGTHVKAELLRADKAVSVETIFDHDYDPDMVSHPLIVSYSLQEPLHIAQGDTVRMHCSWYNESDKALTWPGEMCVMFGWKIGGEQDAFCINGAWLKR